MSKATWKREFYPISAIKATRSWVDAAEHSLQKWIGARSLNLVKHGIDDPGIDFDGNNCSLCRMAEKGRKGDLGFTCTPCPLYMVRGEVSCVQRREDEETSPFYCTRPDPMIKWLRKAVAYAKRKEKAAK